MLRAEETSRSQLPVSLDDGIDIEVAEEKGHAMLESKEISQVGGITPIMIERG